MVSRTHCSSSFLLPLRASRFKAEDATLRTFFADSVLKAAVKAHKPNESMSAESKLDRLNQLTEKLKEDLDRERIKVSDASKAYVANWAPPPQRLQMC